MFALLRNRSVSVHHAYSIWSEQGSYKVLLRIILKSVACEEMILMPAILRGVTATRKMAGAPSGSAEGLGLYNGVVLILVLSNLFELIVFIIYNVATQMA